MNIQPWVDVQFGDDGGFKQFLFMHLIAHQNMAEYLADQNLVIPNYPLDNIEQQEDWLFVHNQVHVEADARLGLTTPQDLELYNLKDETEFYDWMALHGQDHDRQFLAMGF